MRLLAALCVFGVLAGCATKEPPKPVYYRLFAVDPVSNEPLGGSFTCLHDGTKTVRCWEDQ